MKIPADWQAVLQKIQTVYPSAIIAGGALRDLYHGKPVKDVDIFISVNEWDDEVIESGRDEFDNFEDFLSEQAQVYKEQVKITKALGLKDLIKIKFASLYGRDGNLPRDVMAVYRYRFNDLPYEIIFVKQEEVYKNPVQNTISWFDLSICQIGYDGVNIYSTNAYLETTRTKVIRIMNVNRKDRQANRMDRMLSKYPEYTAEQPHGQDNQGS
jgi:hypothetical protein